MSASQQITRSTETTPPAAAPRTSDTAVILPQVGATRAAAEYFSVEPAAISEAQSAFIQEQYGPLAPLLATFRELETLATTDFAAANALLRRRGFRIQLQPSGDPNAVAIVSILDLLLQWIQEGTVTDISYGTGRYPAAQWTEGVEILQSPGSANPIGMLTATNGDRMYVTVADGAVPQGNALAAHCRNLANGAASSRAFAGLRVPMITYDQEIDIAWMIGMRFGSFFVAEALQQTKFRFNHIGARVESAVALTMERCFVPTRPMLVIDRPFYLWIERDGIPTPIIAGYFTTDSWKNPGTLENSPVD